jgi:hypothetical protein
MADRAKSHTLQWIAGTAVSAAVNVMSHVVVTYLSPGTGTHLFPM